MTRHLPGETLVRESSTDIALSDQIAGSPTDDASSSAVPTTILLVDDDPLLRESLADLLQDEGYDVTTAASGSEAIKSAAERHFDLALVDLILPDMNGDEVVRELSQIWRDISCLMMTAHRSVENVLVGANNSRVRGFLLKPVDRDELFQRLREASAFQRIYRENERLMESLEVLSNSYRSKYDSEHQIAEMLQTALLPNLGSQHGPFEVGHYYQVGVAKVRVGGDCYDLIDLAGDRIGILIADVSGKGLEAAVQMGMVRYMVRALALTFPSPSIVVRQLNRVLQTQSDFSGFVTLFYGVFDPATRLLRYVNAGHEPPILLQGSATRSLAVGGPVVGVAEFGDIRFDTGQVRMSPDDRLLLFTDGLSELRGGDSLQMIERLHQWLPQLSRYSAQDALHRVVEMAEAHAGSHRQDDLAAMLLKLQPGDQ